MVHALRCVAEGINSTVSSALFASTSAAGKAELFDQSKQFRGEHGNLKLAVRF